MAVGLDGTGIGVASELRNCQTTKTLYGRFPTRRIGKVTFVFDFWFLCHSFHYVCQAVPLHVFFWAVDRLQIKFVDSLWSVTEVIFLTQHKDLFHRRFLKISCSCTCVLLSGHPFQRFSFSSSAQCTDSSFLGL